MSVVQESEMHKLRRRAVYAYAGSIVAQVVAVALGWVLCANFHVVQQWFK